MRLKVLLFNNSKDPINHCRILIAFFFDVFLGVTLLEVKELFWCCYGIAFCKFEIELASVNESLLRNSSRLNVHSV